jgi:probable blue pigment (indigoidine) exporter
MQRDSTQLGLLLTTAIGPALWGTTYYVTTEWLPDGRPLLVGAMRALPAGLLLLALAPRLPAGDWWWKAPVLGVTNIGAFFGLLFVAAYQLPGGVAGTLGAVQPLIVATLSALVLMERVRPRVFIAGLGAVVGVALLVLRGEASMSLLGVLAGFGATLSMSIGVVLTKRWGRPEGVSLLSFTGWMLTSGGVALILPTLLLEGLPQTVTWSQTAGFAYMAVINTALAYGLWVRGLQLLPASRAAYLTLLPPLVATLVGVAIAGERLTGWQGVGFTITVASFAVAQTTWLPGRSRSRAARRLRSRGTVPAAAIGSD